MRFDEALNGVDVVEPAGSTREVTGVQYDSRRVKAGDVFVAMRGETTDGNKYIVDALRLGAAAVVTDARAELNRVRLEYPYIPSTLVEHGRRALAGISANVFGHPERALAISAVTGTNGKTTTAYLLEQMLQRAGRRCVLVGTIETRIGGAIKPSAHTTPESRDLLEIFAEGVKLGATEAVMEMSSHALHQDRVWGIPVDVAVFTNLTQDHLDYHGTMENYFLAKARLFDGVGTVPPRVAVLNADDAAGARLVPRGLLSKVMTYGVEGGEYRADRVKLDAGRTEFVWETPQGTVVLEAPVTGRVNVYNLMAAGCAALARGLTLEEVADGAANLQQVPGRFQVVPTGDLGFTVVVDYAHTDDALRNLILLARELADAHGGRVITLFGCGGDRDKTKRSKMGRAAAEGSDLVVLTSDNPRSEQPAAILDEIYPSIAQVGTECIVEEDRAGAISIAIRSARPGDMVLLAGKGHEKVQILHDGTVPFSDVAAAADVIKELA